MCGLWQSFAGLLRPMLCCSYFAPASGLWLLGAPNVGMCWVSMPWFPVVFEVLAFFAAKMGIDLPWFVWYGLYLMISDTSTSLSNRLNRQSIYRIIELTYFLCRCQNGGYDVHCQGKSNSTCCAQHFSSLAFGVQACTSSFLPRSLDLWYLVLQTLCTLPLLSTSVADTTMVPLGSLFTFKREANPWYRCGIFQFGIHIWPLARFTLRVFWYLSPSCGITHENNVWCWWIAGQMGLIGFEGQVKVARI